MWTRQNLGAAGPWRPPHLREEALDGGDHGGWGIPMACSICICSRGHEENVRCRGGGSQPRRKEGRTWAAGDAPAKPCPKPQPWGWRFERAVQAGSGESGRRVGRSGLWGVGGRAARRRSSPEAAGVGGGGGGEDLSERERRRARSPPLVVFFSLPKFARTAG